MAQDDENGFLFLGTGSSCSVPNISHLPGRSIKNVKKRELTEEDLNEINDYVNKLAEGGIENIGELTNRYLEKVYKDEKNIPCYSCFDALNENSKNRRNNISLLLKSNKSYVMIDCGKTFRASLLASQHKVDFKNNNLEMILISHSHADAVNGIDDLRDIQQFEKKIINDKTCYMPKHVMKMYMNEFCYNHVCNCFKYMTTQRYPYYMTKVAVIDYYVLKETMYNKIIFDEKMKLSNNCENGTQDKKDINSTNEIPHVGKVEVIYTEEQLLEKNKKDDITHIQNNLCNLEKGGSVEPSTINNVVIYSVKDEYGFIYTKFDKRIKIRFIPFEHGENYVCVGYLIGNNNKIVYISDCSNMNDFTLSYIKKCGPISVLILDALYAKRKHFSHFSLVQSFHLALKINPTKVYFIGMCCELEHNITNMFLKKVSEKTCPNIALELAHDGLFVPFDF